MLTAGVLLALAGCSGGQSGSPAPTTGGTSGPPGTASTPSGTTSPGPTATGPAPVATLTSGALALSASDGSAVPQVQIAVLPLLRTPEGVLLTLDVTPQQPIRAGTLLCAGLSCDDLAAVNLVDTVNLLRYAPLQTGENESGTVATSAFPNRIEAGTTYRMGAWFPLPKGQPASLAVTLGPAGVVPGVPVSEGTPTAGLELAPAVGTSGAEPSATPSAATAGPQVEPIQQLPAAPTGAPIPLVAPVGGGTVVEAKGSVSLPADVLFAFDSAKLTPKATGELAKAAAIVRAKADLSAPVLVIGHTDAKGTDAYNARLSASRAASATTALRRLVKGATFQPSGRGASDPVAPDVKNGKDNPAGRALNRRVELAYRPKPLVQAPRTGEAGAPAAPAADVQPVQTVQADVKASSVGVTPMTAKVYPVRRDGSLALVQVDATIGGTSDAVGADYFALLVGGDGLDAWSLAVPRTGATYGVAHDVTTSTKKVDIASAFDVSTQTTGYRVGRVHRLFAYTALPPAGVTSVDVDLGQLGVVKNVPVQG